MINLDVCCRDYLPVVVRPLLLIGIAVGNAAVSCASLGISWTFLFVYRFFCISPFPFSFLAHGRAYAAVLRLSVCRLSVIVAKRCVLEQKLLLTAYRKSYIRNRLVTNQ